MSDISNKEIGIRIRESRENSRMNKKELASKIHVAPSTIQRYEDGTIAKIKMPIIESIANATNVNPMWIIGKSKQPEKPFDLSNCGDIVPIESGFKIPVLGSVAAGCPIYAEESIIGYEEISSSLRGTGEFFALRIKGDSMAPRMMEGDIVIVRKQDDAESGEIVVVMVNGNEATCKRLMKYKEGIALLSFNPLYNPMEYSIEDMINKPVRIVGKVIESRTKY